MEKYVSTKGKIYMAAMAAVCVLMIAAGILTAMFVSGITRIVLILFYLVVIGTEGWIFFDTSYEFGEEALICRSGPFVEKIPYEKLRRATKCKGYMFSLALSELRIELKYGRKETDAVFISPVNEDEFLEKLAKKAPSLTVYEA